MTYAKHTIEAMVLILWLSAGLNAADTETGTLELTIIDAATDLQVLARVRIRDRFGTDHIPPDSVSVPIANDLCFASSGRVRAEIPPGERPSESSEARSIGR